MPTERVNRNAEMPTIFKVYWAFHNISLIASFVITIIYWTILHNGMCFRWVTLTTKYLDLKLCFFFSAYRNNAGEFNKRTGTCSKFRHYVFGYINCSISVASVSCYTANYVWSYLWNFHIHLSSMWRCKYVSTLIHCQSINWDQ